MNLRKIVFLAACVLLAANFCAAQAGGKTKTVANVEKTSAQAVKSSPAYAEVLLRKTELAAELESLVPDYTEEYPKVKELRFQIALLQKDLDKLLAAGDASKLSLPLGKMFVRRAELATAVWKLQTEYTDETPDVKRAKRKVEIFDKAVKEILP